MPAVNPTRLRFQVEALMSNYSDPAAFHLALNNLFELYANRALRFGDSTGLRPMIPLYHLPAPVSRQMEVDLERVVSADPEPALPLADELWQDPYYETKLVAIVLLGLYPLTDPKPILDRLENWLKPGLDLSLFPKLFSHGTRHLQKDFPTVWENYLETFLRSDDPEKVSVGFLGLAEGLSDPQFQNLPALFRLISPFVRDPQPATSRELAHLLRSLAGVSPTETGYFLRQILSVTDSPEIKRLVSESLSGFPPELRKDLLPLVSRSR
ncbi:MAG: DNA alkylation repair protein [Anaerolineaceae bacterium]|nr:DNA alkylation repair protein [Anaerolineaceae bacterium]